jgi:outer membrane protein TolC
MEAWAGPGGRLIRVEDVDGEQYRVAGSRTLGDSDSLTPEPRYSASLSLTSQIYDFGRTRASVQAAEAELTATEASVLAEQRQIVNSVREAYLDWLSAHASRAIARENVEATALELEPSEVASRKARSAAPSS